MIQPIHILNQMGIMSSFSIAKKITEGDIKTYFDKHKKSGKKEEEIGQLLQTKILQEIHDAIENNRVPGLLLPQEAAEEMGINKIVIKKIPELNKIIMVIAHKLAEKKYDKMSLCYVINSLVNALGLSEEDFEQFHEGSDDDSDDDDDGGGTGLKDL